MMTLEQAKQKIKDPSFIRKMDPRIFLDLGFKGSTISQIIRGRLNEKNLLLLAYIDESVKENEFMKGFDNEC